MKVNKVYQIFYTWAFKHREETVFGKPETDDKYYYVVLAHNKKDAIKYFMDKHGEDEHSVVLGIYKVVTYSMEDYLTLHVEVPIAKGDVKK